MMKNDNGDVVDNNNESNNSNNNRSSRWNHNSSRIIRVSRASGGKDRHSKVWTSKGLRDRRVRLSDSIAEQLYDLQDRLGYDQPNKALERLIKAAENSISELPSYNNTNFPMTDDENQKQTLTVAAAASANSLSKSACSSNSDTSDNSSGLSLSRSELRVKAIERARERTVEETKERDDNLRHSKVETSKGPRDRRVRLSVSTALQFYDLQDRLGYDRPSKAVEWLLKAAEDLISEPPSLNNTNFPMTTDDENQNQTLTVASSVAAGTANSLSCSSNSVTSKNSSGLSLSRSELRDKARERARERTAEETKERDGNNSNSNNHQTTSFIDLLNSGSDLVNSNRQWMAPSSSPAPMEYFSSGLILGPPGQTHFPIQTNAHPLSSISDHQHHLHQEFSFVPDHLISPAGTNGDGAFNIDSNISTTSGAGTAVASAGFSGFNRGTLQSSSTNHHHQSFLANLMKDKEAFCEFLSQRQPPRSLSESTAHDAIEFLLTLPSDRCNKAVSRLSKATFNEIDGDYKENPLGSPIVRTFLQERVKEQEEYGHKKLNPGGNKSEITGLNRDDDKENLLEKYLTTSDLSNLDSLVVHADEDAGKYVRSVTVVGGTERILQVEDEEGKPWQFGFSYLSVSQCYELTKGWSNYVKEKQLGAGDFVFFQRHRTDSSRLFIGFRRREAALGQWDYLLCQDLTSLPTSSETLESTEKPKEVEAALGQWDHLRCQDLTSLPTSSETLKLTEKLKEVETPVQLRIPEQSITGPDPILVIYCGDNQNSKERYFISYISNELCLRGFTPLIYDLTKSTVTGNLEMLQRSRIGIIIFSKNYACSRQCLDEFVAIVDHSKANNLVLLPVFFEVKIAYIRGQSGSFGKAFSRLENSVHTLVSIEKYTYRKGYEVILAKNIVRDVCLLLNSEANMNLRGSLQMKSILSILNRSPFSGPHIVGLWGMVGIGKTTIAGEIFRTQADRYEVCYYLPDFHKVCQTRGLSRLRDEFFSKISGAEKVIIDACDTKLSFTRDRFLCKKVLIVLDGVSNARDAEVLVGGFGWFSGGHTIILTSRNRQVLVQCNAKEIYEIQKLSKPESVHLCCQFATEQNWKGRTSLISELVNYASGNPLALRVLGSSLQKQCINDEKLHLRRFRQHPAIEIRDAFRISFDKLDDNETSIFLDLACFFRGENKDHVVNILDGCGFLTDLGIYGLIDEALISLVDNRIEMPNIFQDTCRFIVCQESNNTGKRSRLWDPNDIVDVLTNNSGTEAIEGLFLDASGLTFDLSPTAFEKMYRLRLLKLYYQTSKNHCKVCLPEGLYSLPDDLRLLHWERYPLGSLPRNFNPKNLVELNMPYSNVTKLWKGTENLEKLKRINLSHSRELTKFPRLSKARNLERIDLEGCTSLVKVNSSILYHHKLTFLNLKDCSRLRIMPTTVHLEALEVLNLSGCSELEDIQDFSPNLKELYLAGTAIRKLPSSIGCLGKLVTLDLENCNRLLHLPPEISNLKVVVTLSGKRPASSLDLSSVEDTASPYKRYRLKRVIETVILSLRKRKRENSVSRVIVRVNEETEEEKKVRDKLVDGDNDDDFDPFAGFCDDRQKSFLNIQKKLEDPDLSEEALVELLQNLECVDITLRDLQGTQIGRHVNRLQRHQSKNVQRLAKQLIKKWKETVDETVRLNQSGDLKPPSLIGKRKEDNSESQNKHHPYQFHHLKDKETSVPESSLSPIGLPFRPEKLEDPDLSEEALVELLQNLGYVDITLQLLQKSDIGQRVNRLQKHRSKNVQRLAKQLIKKWKDTVEESMRLNQPGDPKPPSLIGKGKEGNSESQNKHHLSQFHHPKDRETSVPDGSLNLVGLPLRPGKPVCALYVDTGNCSSGPTCIFDHPSMFPTHKNKSFVFSETPCLNQLGISSSIRDSSSELVEASSKKPRIDKYASSMASETPRLSPLGFSYSIGDSSSEHVEASTVSEITQATVDRDASDSWDVNEEDSQFWLHL